MPATAPPDLVDGEDVAMRRTLGAFGIGLAGMQSGVAVGDLALARSLDGSDARDANGAAAGGEGDVVVELKPFFVLFGSTSNC